MSTYLIDLSRASPVLNNIATNLRFRRALHSLALHQRKPIVSFSTLVKYLKTIFVTPETVGPCSRGFRNLSPYISLYIKKNKAAPEIEALKAFD